MEKPGKDPSELVAPASADGLFRAIFEASPFPMLVADGEGRYLEANPAACALFGVSREQMLGKRPTDFVDPAEVTETDESWVSFRQHGGQTGRFRLRRPDGQRRTLRYHATAHFVPGAHLSILKDITELEQAHLTEREQRVRLEKLVGQLEKERDLREDFVAALTHDLRTPLTAAKISAQMIGMKAGSDTTLHRIAGRIADNVDRADRMIRDLLDANRMKAGQTVVLPFEKLSVSEVVRDTLLELASLQGDRFVLHAEAKTEALWNEDAIRRVVSNLAENAVKYAEPGTPIQVRVVALDEGTLELSVHNVGNPISPEDQARLFQPHQRTEAALRGQQTGWGLGLTLVKGFAEAHGGSVSVESSAEAGTTFRVRLPKDPRSAGR